jgi:hypothetical protein
VITQVFAGFSEGNDLGVGCGIGVGEVTIPAAADDLAIADYDGAHRHLAGSQRTLGGAERLLHPEFIGTNRWSVVVGH